MDNILHVSFGARREMKTEPRWQGDYGQVLVFDDIELPLAYEVHFSNNPEDGEAIGQIGNAEGVTIPDQFFLDGRDVYAWIFLHAGEDDGETRYMVRIPVRTRPDRSDEEPTPVQQSEIDQAIAALNAAVEAAEDAQEAAEDAQEAAEDAAEAAGAAAGAAVKNVQDMIAPEEESTTSAHAYKAGDKLVYSGTLYEVIRAISVGGTLTVGTNIRAAAEGLGNAVYTFVTPLMYGAKGDGVTDDTAAFQAALNSGYNEVFIPTSHGEKYIITDTLTIPTTCRRIYGEGIPRGSATYGAVWFKVPNVGTLAQQRGKALFSIGNTEAVGFHGLHFHCAPAEGGDNRVGKFLDATSTYCDKDINITDAWISNFYTIFDFRGRGLTVINSWLTSASNVAILNWDDANDSQASSHPASMGQRAIRFQNNRIHSIQSNFWHIQSGHAYGMVIQNNVIDHGQGKIIRADDEAWNWNISGNLFQCIDGYTSGGLTMNAMVAFNKGAKNCVIDSNVFSADPTYWENGKVPDGWITIYEGYSLKSCTITGNTFKDYGLRGIWLTGAEGSTITGNTFETSMDTAIAAIVVRGAQVNTAITGNTLKSGSEGAFMLLDETATFTGCEIGHNAHDGAVAAEERGALMQYIREMSPLSTATGASISVTDAAPLDAETLTVAIVPTQAGSGDPAPDNIRAISGITGATVTINSSDLEYEFPEEAGTVYHGTLNVLTGVLTVDYAIETLTSETMTGDKDVTMDGSGNTASFYFKVGSYARKVGGSTVYCTHYKTVYPTSSAEFRQNDDCLTYSNSSFSSKNGRCFLRDLTYTSAAALKEFWDAQYNNGTPVQIAYPLATPLTYQLPIHQITMLRGANTVACDDGDVTLAYRIDAARAMEKAETAYQKPDTGIPAEDMASGVIPTVPVQDVQVNGTSILQDGVANVVQADPSAIGIVCPGTTAPQAITSGQYVIWQGSLYKATTNIASGETLSTSSNLEAVPNGGLNEIATFTQTVTGATPAITGVKNTRYICGECSTLTITAPASGCTDVLFESGSTPTVLTVTSAKTGVTAIKWANGFDPTSLDADTTYEINILDGEFGVVGSWT